MELTINPRDTDTRPSIVTVGMFDGLHLGHRFLLSTLDDIASQRDLRPVALTFDRHPLDLIDPMRAPAMLAPLQERLRMMASCGATPGVIRFDETTRLLSASRFMQQLRTKLHAKVLLMGFNHRLGHDRLSTPDEYRRAAYSAGIEVMFAPGYPHHFGGAPISSTAIRAALAEGDTRLAAEMLGRPYTLEGTVIGGKQIGRTIGFPTANISVEPALMLIPAHGVYAARATIASGASYPAMVNIGVRPTVDLTESPTVSVEAHLIGYEGDLYGSRVAIAFVERMRSEMRFSSIDGLRARLQADASAASAILAAETYKEMP